jgi:GAF domain-containing protein
MTTIKREDPYAIVRERLQGIYWDPDVERMQQRVVDLLQETIPTYDWVGIYLVEGGDLVLGAWRGPEATEHVRIPIGQGICGWAAQYQETVIVDDVNADPRYLACFTSTRAEIVVPIMQDGVVHGEIDVDGDQKGAFGRSDQALLEEIAAELAKVFGGQRATTSETRQDDVSGDTSAETGSQS